MANLGEMVIVYDLLPELAVKLEETVSKIVRKTAFDIQAMAQVAAPFDTGFLKNSIYCEVNGGANEHPYSSVMAPVKEGQELLPEVDKPSKPTEAIVAVAANYGIYLEYGTVHGPARPYLTPAAEAMKVQFEHAMRHLEEAMAKGSNGGGGGE